MNNHFPNIKWFKPSEFDSPDQPGSGHGMNMDLIIILNKIRTLIKRPIIINSGVRSKARNLLVGGVTDTAHLDGNAADVHVPDNNFRFWFIYYAQQFGIIRLFIGKTYIHGDIDRNKPHPVLGYVKPSE